MFLMRDTNLNNTAYNLRSVVSKTFIVPQAKCNLFKGSLPYSGSLYGIVSLSVLRIRCLYIYSWTSVLNGSNRKAMNRNWNNQKANPALKTKAGDK